MNIRTITYFLDPGFPLADDRFADAGQVTSEVKDALTEAGYTVQSLRLAITPFPRVLNGDASRLKQLALDLEAACFVHKLDYAALGPARPSDGPAMYQAIPEALEAAEHVFASASIAEPAGGLSLPAGALDGRGHPALRRHQPGRFWQPALYGPGQRPGRLALFSRPPTTMAARRYSAWGSRRPSWP